MKKFLFVWELGANYGHLTRDLQVAKCLRARGHSVYFAVCDTRIAAELLAPHSFEFVQAPLPQSQTRLLRPPANYAELLLAEGWGNQLSLIGRLRAWISLFNLTTPHTVIADHAPTALLAAYIAGLHAVAFGNGFEIPPPVSPMPSIRPWENIENSRLEKSVKFVLGQANAVSIALGGKPLTRLIDIFPPKSVLASFAELDHYGERANVIYTGSIHGIEFSESVMWKNSGGPKILAYLRLNQKATGAVLAALTEAGEQTICIIPGISQDQISKYATPNLSIYSRPVALTPLLASADVMINYGGIAGIAESLLAGVPLIMIPAMVEQYLASQTVEKLGAGILLGQARNKNTIFAAIRKILSDSAFRKSATHFAEKYQGCTSENSAELAAEAILRSNEQALRKTQ